MNIAFPESQDTVPTFLKVCVARVIAPPVDLLDRVRKTGINRRVSVPEVAIPLNHNANAGNQGIYDELTTYDFLFYERYLKGFKDSAASLLQTVGLCMCGETKNAVDALHIRRVITASVRTVFDDMTITTPARHVESITARNTTLDCAMSQYGPGCFPRRFFCGHAVLPNIRASKGAECDITPATRQ
jgi:hypothetical protein